MSVPDGAVPRRYARPYVLPESLDLLTGPVGGVVRLPRHLAWSGSAVYDLDSPGRVVDLYRTVILEATSPEDLHAYLNAGTLRRLWSYLWLPPVVRQMWQARFADLAAIDALAASAQRGVVEQRHRKIARVALAAAGKFSLALAGGYAIQAHGIGSRPSGDVDLFVNWACRDDFDQAMNAVIAALEAEGMEVTVVAQAQTFVRLLVTDPAAEGEPDKVEVAADWRSHEPVTLEIGPVLHADDAVANKMAALYGRALARDFLDIDAILASGRYSRERLLELAAAADEGFDQDMFADALGALTQITDAAFTQYGIAFEDINGLRHRFAAWRDSLLIG